MQSTHIENIKKRPQEIFCPNVYILYYCKAESAGVVTFMYETGGNDFWLLACCVERVSRLVTPKVTLAGTASGFDPKQG